MGNEGEPKEQRSQQPKEKTRAELQAEFENDLRTNDRYKDFFNGYRPTSVDSFIKGFAEYKCNVLEYGKASLRREERAVEDAERYAAYNLWQIQQRKLFELQCRWRAGLIDLPDVETVWDFHYWGELIQVCPFIPPITSEEFNLYHDFILSDNFNQDNLQEIGWQNYDALKSWSEEDNRFGEYPSWYEYYEQFAGGGDWRLLPDIRGERDRRYRELSWTERQAEDKPAPVDTRPFLNSYDREMLEAFMRKFESPELLRYMQAWKRERERFIDEDLDWAIDTLHSCGERVPIEYNDDWREGILAAARRAERLEVAKGCERAYEEYLRREALGLQHELPLNEEEIKQQQFFRDHFREEVRKGKRIAGERPEGKGEV